MLYKLCFFDTPFGERTLAIMKANVDFPKDSPYSDALHSLISECTLSVTLSDCYGFCLL